MLGGNLSVPNGCEKARLSFHMNKFPKFVASRSADDWLMTGFKRWMFLWAMIRIGEKVYLN